MREIKTGWLLFVTGLFLTTAGFILGNAVTEALEASGGAVSMRKAAVEVKPLWKGGDTLNEDMVKEIKKEYDPGLVACTVKTAAPQRIADWSGKAFDAVIAGADDNYLMFHGFEFISGCFFRSNKTGDLKTAIVSEDFAWKLFRTVDAVGMQLTVYGEIFRITGVFKVPDNILYTLAQPCMPDVIVPAETMLALDNRAYIDSLELAADDSVIFGENTELVLGLLRNAGADTDRFNIIDFATGGKIAGQRPLLIVFAAGFATVLLCCTHMLKKFSELAREIWTAGIDGKSGKINRDIILKYAAGLIIPIVVIAAITFIWSKCDFDFYIPVEYLPGEILDQKKYSDLFKESLRKLFSGISEEAPANIRLLQSAGLLSGVLFRLAFFAGFPLICCGKMIISMPKRFTLQSGYVTAGNKDNFAVTPEAFTLQRKFSSGSILGRAAVLQVICIILTCDLCKFSGLQLNIFTEGILVLLCFIATGLLNGHETDASHDSEATNRGNTLLPQEQKT